MDIDNLTQQDFIEMAQYVSYLEAELENVKANAFAIVAQRDNAMKKLQELQHIIQLSKQGVTTKVQVSSNVDLVNPEQYKEKKQF
jgi:hypothetical protein